MTHSQPLRIEIATPSRPYPVLIGAGMLAHLGAALSGAGIGPSRFVVSSPTVWGFWGETLHEAQPEAAPIIVPDGERHKTLGGVSRIYEALLKGYRGFVLSDEAAIGRHPIESCRTAALFRD